MNKTTKNPFFEGEKPYEDLTITDNFMFAKVMLNENRCVEELNLVLPDEAIKVFINTKGTNNDIDKEFLELLDFFNGELPSAGIAREMQEEINKVKSKEDWRVEYMTMMELERERYREGLERGIKVFIETSLEYGLDDTTILQKMQDKFEISSEQATIYLREYGE